MKSPFRPLLRNHGGKHAEVNHLELYFDLVYVFAVTQLSHTLLEHMSVMGALQVLVLFIAVWWAWVYMAWATNWLDPDRAPNRLMIGMVMIVSLVMSANIPTAFAEGGMAFALAYVTMQVGRTAWTAWAKGEFNREVPSDMLRALWWFCISAPAWIIGALSEDPQVRMLWWAGALAFELTGPMILYFIPGLGRTSTENWAISGGHMAERCALFIIIALGEGVLVTGATFAGFQEPTGMQIAAFLVAITGSFATWWVYFAIGAKRGAAHIEHHDRPGLIARNAFTYWHIPIVAGVIAIAVADEMTLAHPAEPAHLDFIVALVAGTGLFLGGNMMFKRISSDNPWYPLSHQIGLWLTAAMGLAGLLLHPSTLALASCSLAIFAIVAGWEWVSFHGGWIGHLERHGGRVGRALSQRNQERATQRKEGAPKK